MGGGCTSSPLEGSARGPGSSPEGKWAATPNPFSNTHTQLSVCFQRMFTNPLPSPGKTVRRRWWDSMTIINQRPALGVNISFPLLSSPNLHPQLGAFQAHLEQVKTGAPAALHSLAADQMGSLEAQALAASQASQAGRQPRSERTGPAACCHPSGTRHHSTSLADCPDRQAQTHTLPRKQRWSASERLPEKMHRETRPAGPMTSMQRMAEPCPQAVPGRCNRKLRTGSRKKSLDGRTEGRINALSIARHRWEFQDQF